MMREIRYLISLAVFTSLPLGQDFLELQPEMIGYWEGGFHTSVSKFGRKGSTAMTGVDVVLTKK